MELSADNNNNNSQPIVNDTASVSSNSTDAEADEEHWIDYIYKKSAIPLLKIRAEEQIEENGLEAEKQRQERVREELVAKKQRQNRILEELMAEKQRERMREKMEEANQHEEDLEAENQHLITEQDKDIIK
ncbi:hypothetical protein BDF22DRAFT_655023 [Syncephalis plumigaleata]|nr:hypothetical protein BDF22DRAFT_655023 [Syncephalis plumigaleata]